MIEHFEMQANRQNAEGFYDSKPDPGATVFARSRFFAAVEAFENEREVFRGNGCPRAINGDTR
jgi:hypothetical protein